MELEPIFDWLLATPYGQYFFATFLLCRIFVTVAPISLTEKIPDWVMKIISAAALASNKKADNSGNPL